MTKVCERALTACWRSLSCLRLIERPQRIQAAVMMQAAAAPAQTPPTMAPMGTTCLCGCVGVAEAVELG